MSFFLVIFLLNPGTAGATRRLAVLPLPLLFAFKLFFFFRASFSFFHTFKGEETINTANIIQSKQQLRGSSPRWTELLPDWLGGAPPPPSPHRGGGGGVADLVCRWSPDVYTRQPAGKYHHGRRPLTPSDGGGRGLSWDRLLSG